MQAAIDFKLTPLEAQSSLWLKLKQQLETRLTICREKNDSITLNEQETAKLRGEIAAIKTMLDWGKPNPAIN